MKYILGVVLALAFIGSILIANYVTAEYGFIPVGFGLTAAAGTLIVGFTLAIRDAIQDLVGKLGVLGLVVLGAVLSFVVASPQIALASAAAFLFAELLNFAIYTPLRKGARFGGNKWSGAVVASNTVASVADTAIFIGIAFGPAAIPSSMVGQFVGKAWATLAYLCVGKVVGYTKSHQFIQKVAP